MSQWENYNAAISNLDSMADEASAFLPCANSQAIIAMAQLSASTPGAMPINLVGLFGTALQIGYLMGKRDMMLAPFARALAGSDDYEG